MSNSNKFWPTKIRTYDKNRAPKFYGESPKPYTSLQDLVCQTVTEKIDQLEEDIESQ